MWSPFLGVVSVVRQHDGGVPDGVPPGFAAVRRGVFCAPYDDYSIDVGEDFEERILGALGDAKELLVLLTPWSLSRSYVWAEIGAAWGRRIPIIGILHGITANELQSNPGVPVLLKRRDFVDINEIDTYFGQLRERVSS